MRHRRENGKKHIPAKFVQAPIAIHATMITNHQPTKMRTVKMKNVFRLTAYKGQDEIYTVDYSYMDTLIDSIRMLNEESTMLQIEQCVEHETIKSLSPTEVEIFRNLSIVNVVRLYKCGNRWTSINNQPEQGNDDRN